MHRRCWRRKRRTGCCAKAVSRFCYTDSGIGDPPGLTLDSCSTQSNLSVEGRAELRDMAWRLSSAQVSFAHTFTSQWCRCRETARLLTGAPGSVEDWTARNSQFSGNAGTDGTNGQVVAKIRQIPAAKSGLLVTHQGQHHGDDRRHASARRGRPRATHQCAYQGLGSSKVVATIGEPPSPVAK